MFLAWVWNHCIWGIDSFWNPADQGLWFFFSLWLHSRRFSYMFSCSSWSSSNCCSLCVRTPNLPLLVQCKKGIIHRVSLVLPRTAMRMHILLWRGSQYTNRMWANCVTCWVQACTGWNRSCQFFSSKASLLIPSTSSTAGTVMMVPTLAPEFLEVLWSLPLTQIVIFKHQIKTPHT